MAATAAEKAAAAPLPSRDVAAQLRRLLVDARTADRRGGGRR